MEKQPAPVHEQQAALDELQQHAKNFDDQLVINEWQDEIDAQSQQDAAGVHENHSGNSSEITVTDVSQPEELIATTSKKTGQTHFMIKGVNAETGNTYHRFASKQEVNDALGAFHQTESESVAKHMAKTEAADQDKTYQPKHLRTEAAEPTAEQLDRNLRGLISNYRRTKADLKPSEVEEARQEIFAAFEQLKEADGWNDKEVLQRQGMLFREMGDAPAFDPDMTQISDPEGEVEDVALEGESKADTMDRVMKSLGAQEAPKLKTDEELDAEHGTEPELDHPVLNGRNDENFWKEVEERDYQPKHLKKSLLRRIGRRVLINLGLVPDPKQGAAVEAPRVDDGAATEPETAAESVATASKAARATKRRRGTVTFRGAEPAVPEAERSKDEAA